MPTPIWIGSSTLDETSDSPQWTFADRYQCVRTFRGPYATALASAPMPGTAGTGDYEGYFVWSSVVTKEPGGVGKLVITYGPGITTIPPSGAGGSAVLPLDECGITMERLDKPIQTHPRYASLSGDLIDGITSLLQNPAEYGEQYGPDVAADSLALELYEKMKRGFTVYPLWVPVYKWRSFFWTEPTATNGGFIQTPYGPVHPPAIDWLRQADSLDFNGTHWVLERSWIGGPDVDTDVYPAQ
jgi:hypothetical protein